MKKKLIKFIKKQLTKLQECVNINSNETRKDINMKKESFKLIITTFVICLLSIIISGLSDHIGNLDEAYGTVQHPTNNPDIDDLVSIVPNNHFAHMSAGANSAINTTIVVKPAPEEDHLGKEDVDVDNVGEGNDDSTEAIEPELPDINTSIPPVATPDNSTQIDLSQVETENGYYCVWGDFYLTQKEFDLVCTTVHCETGSSKEPFESKQMVATVIFNQLLDDNPYDNFPDTIKGVIYFKNGGNYSVVISSKFKKVLKNRNWTEEVELAVKTALAINPYPRDLLYFRNKHYHTFGVPYKKSGGTYFSTRN